MIHPDPLWYQKAVVYQLHVRGFFDANGDGVGDFAGLTQKLDYLRDLGVTAIWLLPFYPSPLKDDGYDIADYRDIHPHYGTLRDFRTFLREAHRRGLHVITELVLNHTSDQHRWFQRARQAPPGSPERDYYVWSDTSEKYQEARIIFQDYEASNWSWDPAAQAYYWHRFFHHQPDLNYDSPQVQQEVLSVVDFWLGMGVDGLRLDGVPYLFQREGTSCENLPETHAFLKRLRAHVDAKFRGRMFLAEANQWPEDAAAYFGDGDECHTAFHFPLMPRMYMAVQMEDRFPIVDILEQTPPIPDTCQWMLFLRNHDELTLEMVTEQERDFMYRFYARDPRARLNLGIRRRLAPLMENNRRTIELLNGLLFSMPGTPIVYYGDELGMGDNIYLGDRNGVRTPMQWSADRNAGFSRANPQQLYLPPIIDYEYHYEAVNVETQERNPHSLLAWMKRLIRLRQNLRPLTDGLLRFLQPHNSKVLAFLRSSGEQHVLVVANLSRSAQFVELDLSEFQGKTPVEVFGQTRFPQIGELPYLLTLAPHAFHWFAIEAAAEGALHLGAERRLPEMIVRDHWARVLDPPAREQLARALPAFLATRAWHRRRGAAIRGVTIEDTVPFDRRIGDESLVLLILGVQYVDGEQQLYALPLGFAAEGREQPAGISRIDAAIARLLVEHDGLHQTGLLYDAFGEPELGRLLLEAIAGRRTLRGREGSLVARSTRAHRRLQGDDATLPPVTACREEQSNTLMACGDRFLLKFLRRLHAGVHPEVEIVAYLTDVAGYPHVASVAGRIEYQAAGREGVTVAVLEEYVAHRQSMWQYTLDALEGFLQAVTSDPPLELPQGDDLPNRPLVERAGGEIRPLAVRLIGPYLESVERLGRRVAGLHRALGAETNDPAFTPERLLPFHQRSLYQSVRNVVGRACRLLQQQKGELSGPLQPLADAVTGGRDRLLARLRAVIEQPIHALRIRCHGMLGLEEVLCTGDDFTIIDFEGDPDQPLSQRRQKAIPLGDVAGIVWSLGRAGRYALRERFAATIEGPQAKDRLEQWIAFWSGWSSAAFLRSYVTHVAGTRLLPRPESAVQSLLDAMLVERCAAQIERDLGQNAPLLGVSLEQLLLLMESPLPKPE